MKVSKKLIAPLLSIVTFTALGVGSTYALFTNNSDVDIAITAGTVDVSAEIKDLTLYSASTTDTDGTQKVIEGSDKLGAYSANYYYVERKDGDTKLTTFSNGGTATLNGNSLSLDKVTPGDKVTFKIVVTNSSEVDIKLRQVIKMVNDTGLFDGLDISIDEASKFNKCNGEGYKATTWSVITKGTTDVNTFNVTVTLPITAGNEYQNTSCTINFNVEAVQANTYTTDDELLSVVNGMLATSKQKNGCPHAAIEEAKLRTGKEFADIFGTDYVDKFAWDRSEDQFIAVTDATNLTADDYLFTTAASNLSNNYSCYLVKNTDVPVTAITTNKGVDVGELTGITNISYNNSNATKKQDYDIAIRSNSDDTDVRINCYVDSSDSRVGDTVIHYGIADNVILVKAPTCSFYERGTVNSVDLKDGRIVLTEESKVEEINVSRKDESSFYNPIIADGGVLDENMPEIIERDPITVPDGTDKVPFLTIQTLDDDGNVIDSKTEQIYVYSNDGASAGSTEQTITQNEGIESALGLLALDNTDNAGEKAFDDDELSANEIIEETALDKDVLSTGNIARIGSQGYKTLVEAISAAENVSATIRLVTDVDLTSKYAANECHYFDLTNDVLDLNGHTIKTNNYSVSYWADGNGCTIKNGTFEVADGGSYGLFLSYSTGTIALENIASIGGINCGPSCKNVIINNMASTEIKGTNYYAVWVEGNSHVTIENGKFSSANAVCACTSNIGCSITVNGGTFEAKGTANMFNKGGSEIYVNGGTFNKDPSDYVTLPNGVTNNNDGTWTVNPVTCWKVTYSDSGYEAIPDFATFDAMNQADCYYISTNENKDSYVCCTDDTIKVFANGTTAAGYYNMVKNHPGWYDSDFYKLSNVEYTYYFATEGEANTFAGQHDGATVAKVN